MKNKTKAIQNQVSKKTACIYVDTVQIANLKRIIEKRCGISITHVYSEFLRSILSCDNVVVLKKDTGSDRNKKPYSISINSEMTDEIDRLHENKFNYSKTFYQYAEEFIELNSSITIWDSLKFPALKEVYAREKALIKIKTN